MKILIGEDDLLTGQVYATTLRRQGYEVEVATDGIRFLNHFAEQRPDGVIVDIMLPGLNGIEVIKKLRAQVGRGLPVIAVTNAYVAKYVDDAQVAGADMVFNKSTVLPADFVEGFEHLVKAAAAR